MTAYRNIELVDLSFKDVSKNSICVYSRLLMKHLSLTENEAEFKKVLMFVNKIDLLK